MVNDATGCQRLAQALDTGTHELIGMFMPDGAQQLVELLAVGQCHHHQLASGDGLVIHEELLPVGKVGNGIEPSEGLFR